MLTAKIGSRLVRIDQQLHYENLAGLLIRRDGMLHWRCPDCQASGASKQPMKRCPKCKGQKRGRG